jgi:hypothetical protein
MTIVFLAPLAQRRRAAAVETGLAAAAGHRVVLITEQVPEWADEPIDERVEIVWLRALDLRAKDPRWRRLLVQRLPIGLVRLVGRGPLRPLGDKAARKWRRVAVDPFERRLRRRDKDRADAYRRERVPAALAAAGPDRLILLEPPAIELAAELLPGLLQSRPDLRVAFAYAQESAVAI